MFFNLSSVSVLGAQRVRVESSDKVSVGDSRKVKHAMSLFSQVINSEGFDHREAVILFPDDGAVVAAFMIIWFEKYKQLPKVALTFCGSGANPPCPKKPTDVLGLVSE